MMGKTIAFIPVRGGSTSIPLKNIKPMCGKPLVYWTAKAANDCDYIDEVIISTDSAAIKQAVQSFGLKKVKIFERSQITATATASTESAMLEYAQVEEFDVMTLIQATSPLLTANDLCAGFEQFGKPEVDSVMSVVEDKRFYWRTSEHESAEPVNYDVFSRPRRQDFAGWFVENGAFYITKREDLLKSKNRISGYIALSEMSPETAVEIDEPEDWVVVEALLRRNIKSDIDFSKIKVFLTDCDGCLTDAGMYYSEAGDEMKKFNTRDGMAFASLRSHGIKTGIITGENSQAAAARAKKLHMDYLELGCDDKLSSVRQICAKEGISLQDVAYVGDDLNDIELLVSAGVSFCPADACPEAKSAADIVCSTCGGSGVIREVVNLYLK